MNASFLLVLGLLLFSPVAARAETCLAVDCHALFVDIPQPHQPVADGECLACHEQTTKEHPVKGGKSFALAQIGAALCEQCHDKLGKKKVVHAPVKSGDCLDCHQPHGAAYPFLLDVGADQMELCMACHDSVPFKQRYMHGPAAVGACTACHDPHESTERKLLKGADRATCLKCHADFAKALNEAPVLHPPVKDNPCTDCHDPHGTRVIALLKKKMPDLCIECHDEIGKKLNGVKVPHKPLQQDAGCANCHSTHYSQAQGLLPFDEMTACLGCHGREGLGTPPLRNIKKELAGKKYLHGPIAEGRCKDCHDPHGSDYFRMLLDSYPDDIYAPYREGAYDACLDCHEKNLLRFPETTVFTEFRNGNQNLHYLHVANSRKGRTCRTCHEPHASNGEKLISKEGSKFGDWKIPLNFTISPTGGSCSPGCHQALTYDRETPAVYR